MTLITRLVNGLMITGWFINSLVSSPPPPQPTPGMEEDRLAIPTPPANPTQIDNGKIIYYYHCMPCHGDQGQGLTDEWRNVWVEDHRNCWGRGCHGGRANDEGFPIPRTVPGVKNLGGFATPTLLHDYLQQTHPPQEPGRLSDEQYWSVTAYLLYLNQRLAPNQTVGRASAIKASQDDLFSMLLIITMILVVGLLIINQTKPSSKEP
jgi:mono/diheme cytochrome c family protein